MISGWNINFNAGKYFVVPYYNNKRRIVQFKVPFGWLYRFNPKSNMPEKRLPTLNEAKEELAKAVFLLGLSK